MKAIDIVSNYKRDEIKTVVCVSDGLIAHCNALAVDGSCVVKNCLCACSVATIVEQDGFTQYLAIEH